MVKVARGYIRVVDAINYRLGRVVMYGIFVMMAILLWSSISKTFFVPSLWTLEMAQFALVAYYMLGGPYSIQLGSNVRMDLLYGGLPDRRKAWFDAVTVLFLVFYLAVMIWGAASSLAYSLGHYDGDGFGFLFSVVKEFFTGGSDAAQEVIGRAERSPTAWRPYLWPVKLVMLIALTLMLMQALSELFKDILRLRGEDMGDKV